MKKNQSTEATKPQNKIYFPEFWAKRKSRLKPEFLKALEVSANNKPVASDKFGEYRLGTFLYKSAIVSVTRENDLWGLHIFSEHPILLPLIREVRYKFLPDKAVMAQLFQSRADEKALRGVVLYEIPRNSENEEEGK